MGTDVRICGATYEMSEEIAHLYLSSRKEYLSFAPLIHSDEEIIRWVREDLLRKSEVFVALDRGKIVGMMALVPGDGFGWLDHLYLLPGSTGSGIGSALLEIAKERFERFRLYTFQENVSARRFYERHGLLAVELSDGEGNEERCPDVLYEWRKGEKV